eukprot:5929695-Prymnesium_polylepis.1
MLLLCILSTCEIRAGSQRTTSSNLVQRITTRMQRPEDSRPCARATSTRAGRVPPPHNPSTATRAPHRRRDLPGAGHSTTHARSPARRSDEAHNSTTHSVTQCGTPNVLCYPCVTSCVEKFSCNAVCDSCVTRFRSV